jgi:hypothetical protein
MAERQHWPLAVDPREFGAGEVETLRLLTKPERDAA